MNLENITEECRQCVGLNIDKECFEENSDYGFLGCNHYIKACNEMFHKQADLQTEELMNYHRVLGLGYEKRFNEDKR